MIPVSCKESVSFTDSDGIVYKFKPENGALERRVTMLVYDAKKKDGDTLAAFKELDAIVEEIVLGWHDPEGRLPEFGTVKISDILNSNEKWELIGFWREANTLTVEQKKS